MPSKSRLLIYVLGWQFSTLLCVCLCVCHQVHGEGNACIHIMVRKLLCVVGFSYVIGVSS